MMGTKVVLFAFLALFLVAVHFADAQGEGQKKCHRRETYYGRGPGGSQRCGVRPTPWKTEIEEEEYRIECRCRGGLLRLRECAKCIYKPPTTTTAATTEEPATEVTGDMTSGNPVTNPATDVPSTEIPDITSPNPATSEAPVVITSENPAPTQPATQVPTEVPSVP